MILMFVRHAEAKNDKLTSFGKKQLKMIFKEKEMFKFSKIYTTPSNRCVKTARAFQKKNKLQLDVLQGLRERELLKNRKPQNEKEQEWYDNYLNPMYSSENPEGCKEFLARNFLQFEKIIDAHIDKNENAILVAHSGTFYALIAYINGIYKNKNINWYRIGTCDKVYFEINERV